jgi:hypothetical protein
MITWIAALRSLIAIRCISRGLGSGGGSLVGRLRVAGGNPFSIADSSAVTPSQSLMIWSLMSRIFRYFQASLTSALLRFGWHWSPKAVNKPRTSESPTAFTRSSQA